MGATPAEAPPDRLDDVYRRCMEPLFERIQVWFPTLQGCEHDLYQTAWASLLDGRPIEDVEKYLEVAVYRAGLKELRRRRRRPTVSLSVAQFRNGSGGRGVWQQGADAIADPTEPLPQEQVESREDARLLAELLEELTPLQRKLVKLRWGCGIPRREAAVLLGISERSAKREMLAAARVISRNAELARSGRWCEQKRGLVVAYSLGTLGSIGAARAREHLRRCATCREVALAVRNRMEDVAALLPLPALASSASFDGVLGRVSELGDLMKGSLTDLGGSAKEHALGLFARTPAADTAATQVAVGGGLRGGGSAVAALTACLIAGSGATYCAIEGVPESLRDMAPIEQKKETERRPDQSQKAEPQAPIAEQRPPTANVQPQPVEGKTTPAAQTPVSSDKSAEAQPSPAPKGSSEFGAASAAAKASTAAPAPSSGGGEFTP
jgi:RNA polymerase sigma factor (sigma-70 family)